MSEKPYPSLKDLKSWGPQVEKPITESWKSQELWILDPKSKKEIYSIDTPPPYVNSPIHIAQAVTYCYMDFFARYKRMKGYQVLFPLGLDRNGLPIETATEKKYKISPFKVSRDEFIKHCEKLINEGSSGTKDSFSQLGISFTSYKEGKHPGAVYETDSPEYRALTQATFIDLYKKGLVYEDSRINNWDPKLRTTVADSEIEREEKETDLNYVKFLIKGTKEPIIIATTRPELLCTSALIIYNPKDERYKHLKGKKAITPIFGNEVEIIEHEDADPEFGTGLVFMSSSGGDQDAVRFLRKVGIKPVSAIGIDGRMNSHGGLLEGLKTREARQKIIEEIKEAGLMEKQEKIMHSVPIGDRSKAELEFVEMPEFYLKQLDFIKDIKKISKEIEFYPKAAKKILDTWLNSITIDWPISRRRFYATPIPLWNSEDNSLQALPPPGKYYVPWREEPPKDADVFKDGKSTGKKVKDLKEKWSGETRVFDTWMDSSISELFILKYKEDPDFFKKAYPASLRPQGKEIVRTWFYYTLLRGFLETKKPCFKEAWIHQHLTDDKGRKMAKSLGNVVDPRDVLKEHGAEAIRFWSAIEGDLSKQDLRVSKDRIRGELKTLTKILNVSKFIMQFEQPKKKPSLAPLDQLFIDFMEEKTEEIDSQYSKYDFYHPAIELRKFLWDIFASNYLELVKNRAYNEEKNFSEEESESAKYTLHFLLERFLTLLYPICPQITCTIMSGKNLDLLKEEFPKTKKGKSKTNLIEELMSLNSQIWKTKKEKGLSLRDPIKEIEIPKSLTAYEKDLKACHKLE